MNEYLTLRFNNNLYNFFKNYADENIVITENEIEKIKNEVWDEKRYKKNVSNGLLKAKRERNFTRFTSIKDIINDK